MILNVKEKIIKGFIELSIKRHSVDISISYLCQYIHISRRSFYNYFLDRYDVIERIFIDTIEKTIKECLENKMETKEFITQVYYSFLRNKSFFTIAIEEEGQNSLFDTMIERMQNVFDILFKDIISDKKELEYLSYKYASSSAMLLRKWMEDGMNESPEFITKIYLDSYDDYEYKHEEIINKKYQW